MKTQLNTSKREGEQVSEKIPVNREEIEKILESQDSFNAYLEVGGEAGITLGLVNFIVWLDGEEATDQECLELIEKTILYFNHR
jgi:hypothetical protein